MSDKASDVTKTLEKACKNVGVEVFLGEKVTKIVSTMPNIIPTPDIGDVIMPDNIPMSRIAKIITEKNEYSCDEVIVATGGVSYPSTGSTGDGYCFAREYGHVITDIKSGLCGLNLEGNWFKDLQGLTLKNVLFSVKNGTKTLVDEFGELLFTHFGVSGPIVLTTSS